MSTEIPESRTLSCQSEPLNLAVGIIESTRPPSRPMRGASVDLAVQEAQQAAAQGKARLPAKIRLKSQLSPTPASQVRYRLFKFRSI